jgi:hypothetical protein
MRLNLCLTRTVLVLVLTLAISLWLTDAAVLHSERWDDIACCSFLHLSINVEAPPPGLVCIYQVKLSSCQWPLQSKNFKLWLCVYHICFVHFGDGNAKCKLSDLWKHSLRFGCGHHRLWTKWNCKSLFADARVQKQCWVRGSSYEIGTTLTIMPHPITKCATDNIGDGCRQTYPKKTKAGLCVACETIDKAEGEEWARKEVSNGS